MSTVFVFVGQCGNQIGGELLAAAGDYTKRRAYRGNVFYTSDRKFRSVHVDTESKVLTATVQKVTRRCLRDENVIQGKGGRGNNFAYGYYGLEIGNALLERTVDAVRKDSERCENFSGIVMTHSLAGGTGSGLGARLAVELRDEFPLEHLMSCVVHPLTSGETPLQHYNELLCLAKLYEHSDGVIVYSNDDALKRAQRPTTATTDVGHSGASRRQAKGASFSSINKHIVSSLSALMFPNDSLTSKRILLWLPWVKRIDASAYYFRLVNGCSIHMEPWEMVRSLCPLPSLNFMTVDQHSTRDVSWSETCAALLHSWKRHDSEQRPFASLANILVARNKGKSALTESVMGQLEDKVKTSLNCVPWNPYPVDVWKSEHTAAVSGDCTAQLALASNYSNIVDLTERCWSNAKVMYGSRAYLHWYWRHGADEDMFGDSFETVSNIVSNYVEATRV